MRRNFLKLTLFVVLMGGILTACASGSTPKLDGTSWRLTELNSATLPADVEVTLIFEKDSAGGKAACNGYGGSFQQIGNRVSFTNIFQTEMWCEGLMDYEGAYLTALGGVSSFLLKDEHLSLVDGSGNAILVFIRQ